MLPEPNPVIQSHSMWSKLPRNRYFELALEVIRHLRGEMSQRDLSQKLGFTFNQVGKWETGGKHIKFSDFVRIAAALDIPIERKFGKFFYTFQGPFQPDNWLRAVIAALSLTEQEERPWKAKIQGWLKSQPEPDLFEILEILDLRPSLLIAWLSEFIDCQKLDTLRPLYQSYLLRVETVRAYPMAVFVLESLRLKAYLDLESHDEKLLARHSACSVQELNEILEHLLSAEWIYFDGRKYLTKPFDFGFSTIANFNLRGMTKFATDLASRRYSLTPAKMDPQGNVGQSSFRALALSREGSLRARELVLKFHSDLAELARQDEGPKNGVQVFLAHTFPSTINTEKEP